MSTEEIVLPDIDTKMKVNKKKENQIVIFNDDVNTFDHVIDSLIKICGHSTLQAEQCAMMVHHNGKCSVKTGTYEKLKPKCSALLDRGINAEIQ